MGSDKKNDLVKRISVIRERISDLGGFDQFYKYIKASGRGSGFSNSSITYLLKLIEENKNDKRKLDDYNIKVEAFENVLKEYEQSLEVNYNKFLGKNWYLYFFYNRMKSKPKLGRAILSIDNYGKATITNVQDDISTDYQGTFKLINDYILFLDMVGKSEATKIHLKIIVGDEPKELCLGGYISFESQTVFTGSIVLELRMEKRHELSPGHFSYPDLGFQETNKNIIKFLSLKNRNNIKIPKEIYSYNSLARFFESFESDEKTTFFDLSKSIVFLSSPASSLYSPSLHSIKSKAIKEIKTKLENSFGTEANRINVLYPNYYRSEYENGEFPLHNAKREMLENLEILRRTHFYVLMYDSRAVSKSFIELGWALAHCKVILIFYKEGEEFPEAITTLRSTRRLGHIDIQRIKSIEEDKDFIFRKIEFEIKDHLNLI
ncbi:MAG: hypothetical protein P1U70_24410 [Saprospiraceae bacterium]|jgi:hypothetical protein|nr:hypothetical protein [Saprospiraceae bacterium]